jgi:hypothetical protein
MKKCNILNNIIDAVIFYASPAEFMYCEIKNCMLVERQTNREIRGHDNCLH